MKIFTISSANAIHAYASTKEAESGDPDSERFNSKKELGQLAAKWPASRLVEIWNTLPGATPVKKFTDRKTAVVRIWPAIQNLDANGGAQAPGVPPKKAKSGKRATKREKTSVARKGSKSSLILELLRKPEGATLTELMKATGWQAHSVRGFISGTLGKKMGLAITSTKGEDGERSYSVKA